MNFLDKYFSVVYSLKQSTTISRPITRQITADQWQNLQFHHDFRPFGNGCILCAALENNVYLWTEKHVRPSRLHTSSRARWWLRIDIPSFESFEHNCRIKPSWWNTVFTFLRSSPSQVVLFHVLEVSCPKYKDTTQAAKCNHKATSVCTQ